MSLKWPVMLGMAKLLSATMVLLNILGGIWYASRTGTALATTGFSLICSESRLH